MHLSQKVSFRCPEDILPVLVDLDERIGNSREDFFLGFEVLGFCNPDPIDFTNQLSPNAISTGISNYDCVSHLRDGSLARLDVFHDNLLLNVWLLSSARNTKK